MIVNRSTYIDQLIRSKGNGLIKIITGLRRSGKSFLLKKLFRQYLLDDGVKEDHIIIIDMESRKNKSFKDPDYLLDWVEKEMKEFAKYSALQFLLISPANTILVFIPSLFSAYSIAPIPLKEVARRTVLSGKANGRLTHEGPVQSILSFVF